MRLIWDKRKKKWVKPQDYVPVAKVHLQSDWEPFTSPITDEVITSRSKYRDHLRDHGCHIREKGDGPKPKKSSLPEIKADIKAVLQEMKVVG